MKSFKHFYDEIVLNEIIVLESKNPLKDVDIEIDFSCPDYCEEKVAIFLAHRKALKIVGGNIREFGNKLN